MGICCSSSYDDVRGHRLPRRIDDGFGRDDLDGLGHAADLHRDTKRRAAAGRDRHAVVACMYRKPCSVGVTVYVPGGRLRKCTSPRSSVTCVLRGRAGELDRDARNDASLRVLHATSMRP